VLSFIYPKHQATFAVSQLIRNGSKIGSYVVMNI